MVASISFSAFMALTLTPALCATLLKPVEAGHNHEKKGFFGWFNRTFARSAKSYEGWVARLLKRSVLMIGVYLAVIAGAVVVFRGLPTSFLPTEDQGYFIVNVQLPPGAAKERTLEVMKQVEEAVLPQPEVANMVSVLGFSFSGQGQNAALAFVPLKDWSERKGADSTVDAMTGRIMGMTAGIRDAFVFAVNRTGQCRGLLVPPAGPCRPRPRCADQCAQHAAGHGRAEQGAGRRASRRPGRRAAAAH